MIQEKLNGFNTLQEYFSAKMINRLQQNFEYWDVEGEEDIEKDYKDIDIDNISYFSDNTVPLPNNSLTFSSLT